MSLQIGTALRDGFFDTVSRTGAILIAAYLLVFGVYMTSFYGLMQTVYARAGLDEAATGLEPALNAPLAVTGGLVVVCLLLMTYLSVVAMRTFVAGERDSLRREYLTGGVAFALVNLLVGGVVHGVLVTVGFVLLVVPGLFLTVALVFMTMFIAVENDNFVTAMRRSWNLTEGERLSLFALGLVVGMLGFAVGIAFFVVSVIASLAGVGQSVLGLGMLVFVAPLSLYNVAVLASAFNQLRDDEPDEPGTGATTPDAPSTPA